MRSFSRSACVAICRGGRRDLVRGAVGEEGGRVVVTGTPEQVAQAPGSHTGRYLREALAVGRAVLELPWRASTFTAATAAMAAQKSSEIRSIACVP